MKGFWIQEEITTSKGEDTHLCVLSLTMGPLIGSIVQIIDRNPFVAIPISYYTHFGLHFTSRHNVLRHPPNLTLYTYLTLGAWTGDIL